MTTREADMVKKQMIVIISLAAAVILLIGVIIGLVVRDGESATAVEPTTSAGSTSPAAATTEEAEDPAPVLADAEVNSIHPAPAPEAVEEWGDYKLHDSWDGRVRVFEDAGPKEITAPGGQRFPATMNNCGFVMYYVTFRSVNPEVRIEAHLLNALGEPTASREVNQGWSLSTNCETPALEFISSGDVSTLGDVVYAVHEYRQSSVAPAGSAQPDPVAVESVDAVAPAPPVTTAAPAPTLVQCMGYLGPPVGLYSDGVERSTPGCADSPEVKRAIRGESVCGGMYGWMEVSAAEYLDLCGAAPPTDRTPPPTPAQGPSDYYDPYERNEPYSYP